MGNICIGVDTSNYTTSLALCRDGKVIKSVRRLLPVDDGKCGLRQSDAVFLHVKALPELAGELFSDESYSREDVRAIGVSASPRDVPGSYMPCFLAGISFASGISESLKIPLYKFSHQSGHIMAAVYSSGNEGLIKSDFISFHVSGGTTEALCVKPKDGGFDCRKIGGTSDANAGQIIDRAGVLLGLPFPCGKALDEMSQGAAEKVPPTSCVRDTFFSLSGLQNKFEAMISEGEKAENAALFLFESIARSIERATVNIRKKYGDLPVLYAGGVMSNTVIRSRLSALKDAYFASVELSSDNAAGTALLCEKAYISAKYEGAKD